MTTVILEHDASKLANLTGEVEVCDPSGRVLGYFRPNVPDRSLYEGIEIPVTEEELQRSEQEMREGKGFTTAQVLDHLKGLEAR